MRGLHDLHELHELRELRKLHELRDLHVRECANQSLTFLRFYLWLYDTVSTIATVVHNVDKACCRILEHIKVMTDEVSLHKRFFLGHRTKVDKLFTHQYVVVFTLNDKLT